MFKVFILLSRHQKVDDFFSHLSCIFMKGHLWRAHSFSRGLYNNRQKLWLRKNRRNAFFPFDELTNWMSRVWIKSNLMFRVPIWMKYSLISKLIAHTHKISVVVVVFNRIYDIPLWFENLWRRWLKFILRRKCLLKPINSFFHETAVYLQHYRTQNPQCIVKCLSFFFFYISFFVLHHNHAHYVKSLQVTNGKLLTPAII